MKIFLTQLYDVGDIIVINNKRYKIVELKKGEKRCLSCPFYNDISCNSKLNHAVGKHYVTFDCKFIIGPGNRLQIFNSIDAWKEISGG